MNGVVFMTKKAWSTQELDKLMKLSREYPPIVIAQELSRPVSSVRKKMQDFGVPYVTGEQWRKRQIQHLLSEESSRQSDTAGVSRASTSESPILEDFWRTLLVMARVAKKRGKRVDVLSFIDTYRKIRTGN
jgi:hypothetical protein